MYQNTLTKWDEIFQASWCKHKYDLVWNKYILSEDVTG